MIVNNICWSLNGKYYATTWHKLINGCECEEDPNWDAMAEAARIKAAGEIRGAAEIICINTPLVVDNNLEGNYEMISGTLHIKV